MDPSELPEELFHYTGPIGTLGILQGSIWATMVQYMNDGSEFQYALDLSKKILRRLTEGEQEAVGARCEEFLDVIRLFRIFAISLSADPDLLSQWRAYCPPEGGYAIGFSLVPLRDEVESKGFELVRCVYCEREQVRLLEPLLGEMVEAARHLPPEAHGIDLRDDFLDRLARIGVTLKDPSFEEEQEWRLISERMPPESIKHRAQENLIVPYYDLSIAVGTNKSPISCVWVGPNRYPRLAKRSISSLTSTTLNWPVRVKHSKSPFRVIG